MKSKTAQTLTAGAVTTVSLTLAGANYITVQFISGTGPIYFTVNGVNASNGGDDQYVLHARNPVQPVQIDTSDAQTIKLWSATADVVAVLAERR